MSTTGGSSSRKFVTEELLTKLNTVLEQLARKQPPINPSVDAYKRENEKVEFYLNALKTNPDDPYLRAQLHQAMDDKLHLYNLIQGKKTRLKLKPTLQKHTNSNSKQHWRTNHNTTGTVGQHWCTNHNTTDTVSRHPI